jgi:hypothetical protein
MMSNPNAAKWFRLCGLLFTTLLALTSATSADPLPPSAIPDPLKTWVPWVLQGHGDRLCPPHHDASPNKECVWLSRLEMRADAHGGQFKLDVEVFGANAAVPLPGEAGRWPQDVRADNKAVAVIEADGSPTVSLPPGRHALAGAFSWSRMPQDLMLPKSLATLSLSVDGVAVQRTPDADGRLWLTRASEATASADALTERWTRLVDDDIPLHLTTHVELAVAGKPREIVLGSALLPGFVVESVASDLPLRLQDGGAVAVQVRPGNWNVELRARRMSPLAALMLPASARAEIWSFQAHNDLRLVSVEGVAAVDPKQVAIPDAWRKLPAYRVNPGDSVKLIESRRGNPLPEPDRLSLARQIWLDFDGGGYTVHDRIGGTLSRSARLELDAPGVLGRAALAGVDQPITRMKADGPAGVEVRSGAAQLSADSRIDGAQATLPASGWRVDFNSVAATLELPPGWRLIHATGVDRAHGSWVSAWTLWDFFFVLVSALAAGKLFGWRSGVVFGAALALSWHMSGSPQALWPVLLALHALAQALPAGRPRRVAAVAERVCAGVIALVLLPYAVAQFRYSIYPSLERGESGSLEQPGQQLPTAAAPGVGMAAPMPSPLSAQAPPQEAERGEVVGAAVARVRQERSAAMDSMGRQKGKRLYAPATPQGTAEQARRDEIDPAAKVGTGPGVPSWTWASHRLEWQGPVKSAQQIVLVTLPPAGTVVLRLGGLALMVLALLSVVGNSGAAGAGPALPGGGWRNWRVWLGRLRSTRSARPPTAQALSLALAVVVLAAAASWPVSAWSATPALAQDSASADGADSPSKALLDELRDRLTAAPDCMPHCAEVARLMVIAAGSRVQLQLEVHAQAAVAMPLPGQGAAWRPANVTLAGLAATTRRDDAGTLWIALPAGVSQVVLDSDVGNASAVEFALPTAVRQVEAQTTGWALAGLDASGRASGALSLSRQAQASASEDRGSQRDALPPFVRIERSFQLGLRWTVQTQIVRLSPSRSPIRVQVALVAGEAVNDDRVNVSNGVASVQLGGEDSAAFASTLAITPRIDLISGQLPHQIEVWKLDVATQWNAELSGIAPVVQQQGGRWLPQWQPWPGEKVGIAITRPAGVAGQTLTVDSVKSTLTPGLRATDVATETLLRASQGGNHVFQIPAGAELLAAAVDGETLPLQATAGAVAVPITPGRHLLRLGWREAQGMGWLMRSQGLRVGASGVDDRAQVEVPADRVVLAVGGPRIGPAVLFWGVLIGLVGVSWALARSRLSPLGFGAWLLLGVGIAQTSLIGAVIVGGWFFAFALRERFGALFAARYGDGVFNPVQIGLIIWTAIAAGQLLDTVRVGLLGFPNLMIEGNGSDARHLYWYADRFADAAASVWVVSIPVLLYRGLMLLWALWLAASLLKWVRWAWQCFGSGGYWLRAKSGKVQRTEAAPIDAAPAAANSGSVPPASAEPPTPQ